MLQLRGGGGAAAATAAVAQLVSAAGAGALAPFVVGLLAGVLLHPLVPVFAKSLRDGDDTDGVKGDSGRINAGGSALLRWLLRGLLRTRGTDGADDTGGALDSPRGRAGGDAIGAVGGDGELGGVGTAEVAVGECLVVEQVDAGAKQPGAIYRSLCRSIHGSPDGPFGVASAALRLEEDHSYPHTNLPAVFLEELFSRLRPRFLVEVGSFKGGSALRIADAIMAAEAKAADASSSTASPSTAPPAPAADLPCLLCVDTWLGDTAMWLNHNAGWRDWLLLEDGHPRLYWQFLANVRRRSEVILPLPLTSACALRALQQLVIRQEVEPPEFIYLDSAHEKGETLLELRQSFRLLAVGGVIVGDDWDWPAVESDVREFLDEGPTVTGIEDELLSSIPGVHFLQPEGYWVLDTSPRQWILRKGGGTVEELRGIVDAETLGVEPAAYRPLTEADREALRLYEEGEQFAECGDPAKAAALFCQAARTSASAAAHFGLEDAAGR